MDFFINRSFTLFSNLFRFARKNYKSKKIINDTFKFKISLSLDLNNKSRLSFLSNKEFYNL